MFSGYYHSNSLWSIPSIIPSPNTLFVITSQSNLNGVFLDDKLNTFDNFKTSYSTLFSENFNLTFVIGYIPKIFSPSYDTSHVTHFITSFFKFWTIIKTV